LVVGKGRGLRSPSAFGWRDWEDYFWNSHHFGIFKFIVCRWTD